MNIHIIYHKFYEFDGSELTIGGIQTYIQNLTQVLSQAGHTCSVIQLSNTGDWFKKDESHTTQAYDPGKTLNTLKQRSKFLLQSVYRDTWTDKGDLVIWGTDAAAVKDSRIKSISIQHGIGFDGILLDSKLARLVKTLKLQLLHKFTQRVTSVMSFLRSDIQVCVDYNYLNWVRTMVPRRCLENAYVIPNFTATSDKPPFPRKGAELRVLFARRFSEERGSLLMLEIAKQLLKKYDDIYFTLAGDGKYKVLFEREFGDEPRVQMTKFKHNESFDIHSQHHIALVPTCWSEGTSLSLLEAMTTGCVPIVTNVGGMTNIVLDGFNGKMLSPKVADFVEAISYFYQNEDDRARMQNNAKNSVDQAFSRKIWAEKWVQVVNEI